MVDYQKSINLLDNTSNQPSKFTAKNCVDARGTYDTSSQFSLKTLMLKPSLCDYSDAYLLVKRTISAAEQAGNSPNNYNKEVVF